MGKRVGVWNGSRTSWSSSTHGQVIVGHLRIKGTRSSVGDSQRGQELGKYSVMEKKSSKM